MRRAPVKAARGKAATTSGALAEARNQLAATSEILRVISRSRTDVQPVFDSIVAAALKLCAASSANLFTYDGELIHLAAASNINPTYVESLRTLFPRKANRDTAITRAIMSGSVVLVPDVLEDREYAIGTHSVAGGFRSVLAVPLMSGGKPIGGIAVGHAKPRPFDSGQVALLQTFADQAVIAIENVRLFNEIEARNRALTEALEQQTATSEILGVISRSRTDVQPVFDTIAASALKLCGASVANVFTYDGSLVHLAALVNLTPEGADAIRSLWPRPARRELAAGRAILTRDVVEIPDVIEDADFAPTAAAAVAGNFRSILAVPLMREGNPIGAIAVGRPEAGVFPASHVALLRTFADQAVIAIENVRLFTELATRNGELSEALEQRTATAEILQVISRSHTDAQPVFDTIVHSAVRLCGGLFANVLLFDGERLHFAATSRSDEEFVERMRQMYPMTPDTSQVAGRVILNGSVVAMEDALADREYAHPLAIAGRMRRMLGVPMMRGDRPIGVIVVCWTEAGAVPKPQVALLETFADQAVIAIENVRLFNELEARNRALTEALEQQTATSEILRVISRSPTDTQPVFDTIVRSVLSLCDAAHSGVYLLDGDTLSLAATAGLAAEARAAFEKGYPRRIGRDTVSGRAALECRVVQTHDLLNDPMYGKAPGSWVGARTVLAVPLMREGKAIGSIGVWRAEVKPFSASQIALLETFADQAVIAIENVRLFKELEARNRDLTGALERETATGDVLKVISRSAFDLQPVLDTVIGTAARLCGAEHGHVYRYDGELLRFAAGHSNRPEMFDYLREHPVSLGPGSISGAAAMRRAPVHWHDVLAEPGYQRGEVQKLGGYRTILAVPMLRGEELKGVIVMWKTRVEPFTDKQVELVATFADQAVIAIENVRLFNEVEARNRELRVALEQQTATSEVLKVIGRAAFDLQPVFETLVENAVDLCDAERGLIFRLEGELLRVAATHDVSPELKAFFEAHPISLSRASNSGRAALERRTIHNHDVLADPDYRYGGTSVDPYRTVLAVPMLKDERVLGVIIIYRHEVRPFTDSQVALVETFADQAVIAIENVRLFTELEARTRELTRSVGELRALGEVGRAVSSTLNLETVLATIVSRATELAGMDGGSVWEYDDAREEFRLHATNRMPDALVEALRAVPVRKGEGALGRLAVTREPVEILDIANEGSYPSRLRSVLTRHGYRSVLAVPLLREEQLLGALAVNQSRPGGFAPGVIELLKTFATQSALAIQNARLFREIEQKSRELEAASRHKSEFLANMSHELRTPLNAIIGFSEVLLEQLFGPVNEKQADYLRDILESGRHLLALINDILDLSKIEAGRMELEASEFDLPRAIENALILVRERASRHGIELVHDIDPGLGAIRADERKVKQVLLNLLTNALKFTPDGGRVEVRARTLDGVAEIAVEDTGIGIAAEEQAAVFEEFRQVGTASKKVEGTGLGLAISRKFVELHGGRIGVTSTPGTGSTFAFTLPLR